MYDPKFSQKQMYDQYGRSRKTTTNANKQFAETMKSSGGGRNMSGIGAKPPSFQDNNPNRDESENKSTIAKVYEKTVDLLKSFGAEEPKDVIVDGKRVYQGPAFRGYAPTTRTGDFGGEYGKKNYFLGMEKLGIPTYPRTDVSPTLPPSTINAFGVNTDNPRLNMFGVNRSFTQPPASPELPTITPQPKIPKAISVPIEEDYIIEVGDTLSEIAEKRGTTVDVLLEMNDIADKDKIYAGDKLKVPTKKLTDTQAALRRGLGSKKDMSGTQFASLDPDYDFYQSMVPMDQRIIEPEGDYLDNLPRDRELMINTGNPDYNFMGAGSKYTQALKKKEADNYDTIFGNAEVRKTPFKGTKVSDMTLDEVLEFTKLNGKFHKYNKKKGHNTTAVGKYQIVGSTLRDLNSKERGVLKRLGITGSTKFDEKTQDDIAAYLAVHRLKDRATGEVGGTVATRASARKELRNEWQGFQKLSDDELDEIIDEIAKEINVNIVDVVPESSLRPQQRPPGMMARRGLM